jgi:hypothetical protein
MLINWIHITAITTLCLVGPGAFALAQISGPSSNSAPGSVPGGGIGPAPAPTSGQSITIPPNTPGTPQGIGPAPAPTPGQSTSIPGPARASGSTLPSESVRTVPTPRQSRMRGARTPREATTVGSGSPKAKSPSRPECFETPNIVNEPGVGGNQNAPINTPQLHPQTGRALAGATKC